MIKRAIELSREPSHLTVRDHQLLILRKLDPPRHLPAHPPNLAASIPTEDLGIVLVDEFATTYSHAALAELAERGAALVICGRDHLPAGLLLPLAEHTEVVWRLDDQINASKPLRKQLWRQIVQAKVRAQARMLPDDPPGRAARTRLLALARLVKSGDTENHEAQAARIYWSAWLGERGAAVDRFHRRPGAGDGDDLARPPNNFLDYGYAVLRAAVARALVLAGLLPALGLQHRNRSNAFCLADDLVEPLRPMVDEVARDLYLRGQRILSQPNKAALLIVLNAAVRSSADGERGPLMVALHRYAASLAACLAAGQGELDIPLWAPEPPGCAPQGIAEDDDGDEQEP